MKKLTAAVLCLALALSSAPQMLGAAQGAAEADTLASLRSDAYQTYYQTHLDKGRPVCSITPDNTAARLNAEAGMTLLEVHEGKEQVIAWQDAEGWVEYEIEIPEDGCYSLRITYMPMTETCRGVELGVLIDGEPPFRAATNLTFSTMYESMTPVRQDKNGNDVKPRQQRSAKWITESFSDPDRVSPLPIPFYLEKGRHVLRLEAEMADIYLASLTLFNDGPLPSNAQYMEEIRSRGLPDAVTKTLTLEGEDANYRSDPTLIPSSDRTSAKTSPNSPERILLNTIGQGQWKRSGQWILWELDVRESGFYKLGFRFKQDTLRGFHVTRRIYVDDAVPFAEFDAVTFPFGNSWQYDFAGGDEAYPVYLSAGRHTIKMEVVLGSFTEILWQLDQCIYDLNYLYRKIIMITGKSPDKNRDYFLEEQIPGLMEGFTGISVSIRQQAQELEGMSQSRGSEAAFLYEVADQLDSFVKKPDTIKTRLEQFSTNISSLSAWVLQMKEQPLELDYIDLLPVTAGKKRADAGFWDNLVFRFRIFFSSFTQDYSTVGGIDSQDGGRDAMLVWVNSGIDQAGIIRSMIDDMFAVENDIPVNLQLVQGGLIEATLAGKGPDVALLVDRATPVNLAARGALIDLSRFPDYSEVIRRFAEGSLLPYTYDGKGYALPVTQSFNMMFYRTDIFGELGLSPPQTWDELAQVISVLQANNMQAGVGVSVATNQTAVGDIFAAFLLQKGLSYYTDDLSRTTFNQPEAVEAFTKWTQLYTQTTLPVTFDFYNRFRSGEMPLGIQPYTQYNMISVAAPEIYGMWEMAPIPGTPDESGGINRSENASGTGCMIFNKVKSPEDAWTFLKWWTSAEAQERYGRDLEMLMGSAARYETANLEAFQKLPWSNAQVENISAQWDWVQEIPEIPASYYTTRGISNAFRSVVYSYENPREVLFYQNKLINKEIQSKREELGLE